MPSVDPAAASSCPTRRSADVVDSIFIYLINQINHVQGSARI